MAQVLKHMAMIQSCSMQPAPSAPNQPFTPWEPNPIAVAGALEKQPKAATSTPPDEAGPNIKPQAVSKKLEDYSRTIGC
jgi:hypothetical protein